MDDTIKIRGGGGVTPDLQDREPGYNRNEKALYIGTPEGNVRLCGADDVDEMKEYADSLMGESKDHTDVVAGEAKEYIDGLIVEAKEYADAGVAEAKEYTDTVALGAKEYIDGQIAEVKEYSDVFYAVFGVTTGEEINAAYQAGKIVACKLDTGKVLYLVTDWGTGNGFTFSSADYASVTSAEVEGDTWVGPTVQALATKEYIDGLMEEVNRRLDALETPDEPEPEPDPEEPEAPEEGEVNG